MGCVSAESRSIGGFGGVEVLKRGRSEWIEHYSMSGPKRDAYWIVHLETM